MIPWSRISPEEQVERTQAVTRAEREEAERRAAGTLLAVR